MRTVQFAAVSSLLVLAAAMPSRAHASDLVLAGALPSKTRTVDRDGTYAFADIGITGTRAESSVNSVHRDQFSGPLSMRIGAGYRVNRYFAVEGGIHSVLKKAEFGELGSIGNQGVRIAALGIIPIGQNVELLGKVSFGSEWSDWSRAEPSVAYDQHVYTVGLGLGARYWFNDRAALRLDIEGLDSGSFMAGFVKHDYGMASTTVGFQYRF